MGRASGDKRQAGCVANGMMHEKVSLVEGYAANNGCRKEATVALCFEAAPRKEAGLRLLAMAILAFTTRVILLLQVP